MRAGCVWGKIEDGEADAWGGGREKDVVERGQSDAVPIWRKKLRFLEIPNKGNRLKKFRKCMGQRGGKRAVKHGRKAAFLRRNAHSFGFPDKGKINVQFRIRQVDMQKRKAPFILCTSDLKIAFISCTIQNRICMIRERKSNHENVFQTGQKGKMPIARTYSTVIL